MKHLPRAQIRTLTPADQRILLEALALLNRTQGDGLFEADYLTKRLDQSDQFVIGAFAGDELLGVAVAELITNFDYYLPFDPEIVLKLAHKKVASFTTMSVVESEQGKGIGKMLSEKRLEWVRAQNCDVVLGVSWESGKAGTSRRTFEGSGFRAVERLPDFYVESSKLKPFHCPGCETVPCTCGKQSSTASTWARMLKLKVVLEDEGWVLVDKPARFHTHPPESKDLRILPRWNAQAILEAQLGMKVFPAHRLDRATSGLLLYSKHRSLNEKLQRQFAERSVKKHYFAVVRGLMREERLLEEPLKTESGEMREARTLITPCFSFSLSLPHPRDPASTARPFTFVKAEPLTGRFHQIRRHLAGIGHPILLDARHGDKKLNRAFSELTGCNSLLLRCMGLAFRCPRTGTEVNAWARWGKDWHRLFEHAGGCPLTTSPSRARPSPS